MRGLIVLAIGPLAVIAGFAFVLSASPEVEAAPAALDAASKDALPSPDAIAPAKDAFLTDAKSDAAKKPDAQLPPKPIPPDPTPLAADAIFVMTVHWNKGVLTISKTRREKLAKKEALPRHLGRFAAELYSGPDLVERLRFDIPLIEDDTALGDTYAKGLDVNVEVRIPDSVRPNKMEIWDRATDRRWSFPYPPVLP